MSVSGISSASLTYQPTTGIARTDLKNPQAVFDGQMMKRALSHGDVKMALQSYEALSQATDGSPFRNSQLTADFQAIGQQLQAGNISGAQQAFATLQSDFNTLHGVNGDPAPISPAASNPGAASGSAIDFQA